MLLLFPPVINSILMSCHTVVVDSLHSFPVINLPKDPSVRSGDNCPGVAAALSRILLFINTQKLGFFNRD